MGPLLGCPRGALRVGGAMHCVTGGNTEQPLLRQTFVLSGLLGMVKQLQLRSLMSIEMRSKFAIKCQKKEITIMVVLGL